MKQYRILKPIYNYNGVSYKHAILTEEFLDTFFSERTKEVLILDKYLELIPEHKYKVGDWVKLSSDNIKKISEIKNSIYYFDPHKYAFEEDIKCKVKRIEKTVYLYEDLNRDKNNNNYVFASSSETNFFKTIDQQQVTFWEEVE